MSKIKSCQRCGSAMLIRKGPYGLFWACPNSRPNHTAQERHPTHKIGNSVDNFDEAVERELDEVFEIGGYGIL